MTNVRILFSGERDGDVARQLALVESLPRVRTFDEDPIRENRTPLILASAFRLLRDRPIECPIITAGSAALMAASIAWRGPIVHLSSAPISRLEVSLLRRRRATQMRLVTSSLTDVERAKGMGLPATMIDVIRPALPPTATLDRAEIRARLGIREGQPALLIPGTVRRGTGHRLATWSAGILVARDTTTRLLMRNDPWGANDRFAKSTVNPGARIWTGDLDDATLAAAADVAIVVPEAAPQLSAIAAAAAAGTPIVSTSAFWAREALHAVHGARLLDDPKPRLIARAALNAIESPRPETSPMFDLERSRREWLAVVHCVCGPLPSSAVRGSP